MPHVVIRIPVHAAEIIRILRVDQRGIGREEGCVCKQAQSLRWRSHLEGVSFLGVIGGDEPAPIGRCVAETDSPL